MRIEKRRCKLREVMIAYNKKKENDEKEKRLRLGEKNTRKKVYRRGQGEKQPQIKGLSSLSTHEKFVFFF